MPILIYLGPSSRDKKRLTAVFRNPKKTIHFGLKGGMTYIDGRSGIERENYIKRHSVNEDHTDPLKAGTLSRYLLWGDSRNLETNLKNYMKMFDVKDNRKKSQ